jgi:hypothetical protein
VAHAQPQDVPNSAGAGGQFGARPREEDLLPLGLDEWMAQRGGLTRLKIKAQNATALDIADEVAEQTGLTVVIATELGGDDEKAPRFSVEANGEALWPALASWNRGRLPLGLVPNRASPGAWVLAPYDSTPKGAAVASGPGYFSVSRLSISRGVSLGTDKKPLEAQTTLTIQGAMRLDPRFAAPVLALAAQIDGAIDDQGRAIPTQATPQSPLQWGRAPDVSSLMLSLQAPAADAKYLRSLKGTLRLAVEVRGEDWEVNLAAAPGETPAQEKLFKSEEAQVKARFEGIAERGGNWVGRFTFERRVLGPLRVFRSAGREAGAGAGVDVWRAMLGDFAEASNAIRVFTAEGFRLPSQGGSGGGIFQNGALQTTMEINVASARTAQPGAMLPTKIRARIPLEWREVRVPFEFSDLPLP